jgi:hypothetical protein
MRRALPAILVLSAAFCPMRGIAQQTWNDPRSRALVERATERRAAQLADTALADYKATAHGYLTFLAQFGEGFTEPPKIVRADELGLEIYWRAPDLSKQRILGRRDTLLLPTDIQYHRDHLGIIQNNFPSIIRLGDGDEVRDVPHPLSPSGLAEYDFAIRDSLEIRLGASTLHVYEVRVRPKNDKLPRAVGALYIDRDGGEVVRMALGFTRAALKDKTLDDVSVVLENGLIEGRFWLPRRQEIEIRRTASWMDYPARGIIRGRWEVCCYQVNTGIPASYFAGPEIVLAMKPERDAFRFQGEILDSLPPDVRTVSDEDVRRVQEEARALVRAQSLARPRRLMLAATNASDIIRFNRVEGLALGSGLDRRVGGGAVLAGSARYGFSDHEWKGRASAGLLGGTGGSVTLFAERQYADVSDEAETSGALNSIAAQEFGSDYTDRYDVRGAGFTARAPLGNLWIGVDGAYERQAPLGMHASPAIGRFEPTIPAERLRERRATLSIIRPTSLTLGGWEAAATLSATGISYRADTGTVSRSVFRPLLSLDLQKPFGASRIVLHTLGAAAISGDPVPAQHLVYLGGPTTAPGYEFHQFAGQGGFAQRLELRTNVPFFAIPLGRYGKVPGELTLAPYANTIWTSRGAPFKQQNSGWFPSVGLGVMSFFDIVRIDVARGLRRGRWTFSVDAGRDFWSVL